GWPRTGNGASRAIHGMSLISVAMYTILRTSFTRCAQSRAATARALVPLDRKAQRLISEGSVATRRTSPDTGDLRQSGGLQSSRSCTEAEQRAVRLADSIADERSSASVSKREVPCFSHSFCRAGGC